MQDVAIAHGYNNIPRTTPNFASIGAEQPLNQLSDMLRAEAAMAGYTEVLTWALCSRAENFGHMRLKLNAQGGAVSVGNPATAEFEICRTSLLPGTPYLCAWSHASAASHACMHMPASCLATGMPWASAVMLIMQ